MEWRELRQQVCNSWAQLDDRVAALRRSATAQRIDLYCTSGCANCCTLAVNCTFAEAAVIAGDLSDGQRHMVMERLPLLEAVSAAATTLKGFLQLYRDRSGACPFLDEQQCCTIYLSRPLSCRALLSTRPAAWCGVDFATLHPLEKKAFLSSLDAAVVAYPSHYLAASQEQGARLERGMADWLERQRGVRLGGNLIWLLGMELQHRLSERLLDGDKSLAGWLSEQQHQHPYLVHFG